MIKKLLMTLIILALLSSILTGCRTTKGAAAESKRSVSLVVGAHDHFPELPLMTPVIQNAMYEASYSYGNVSVIVIDGQPYLAANWLFNKPKKAIDEAKHQQLANNYQKEMTLQLPSLKAKTAEVDTLTAIQMSANTLNSNGEANDKTMIIVDSGLSTTSLLNFASEAIIDESPKSIVKQLKDLYAIPDLSGIKVIWIGCGVTNGKQTPLTSTYKHKLLSIWKVVLEAGNADSVTFDVSTLSDMGQTETLPSVSLVPVVEDHLTITKQTLPEVTKWDEHSPLRFKPDSAKFVSVKKAKATLKPVAAYLKSHRHESIYIFGMTATVIGGNNGVSLSKKRAKACYQLLKAMGVKSNQMHVVGLGQLSNPLRVKDINSKGRQTKAAKKNRAVFIIKSDSPMISTLLKS